MINQLEALAMEKFEQTFSSQGEKKSEILKVKSNQH